jgi:hypothetical protein
MEMKNLVIRHDIEAQHLNTKIKLVNLTNFSKLSIVARYIDEA